MSARKRLDQLLKGLEQSGRASASELLRVLSLSRELAEATGTLNSVPHLKRYADWTLHSEIQNCRHVNPIVESVDALIARDAAGEKIDFPAAISSLLSLAGLRRDLKALWSGEGLPLFLIESKANWLALVAVIAADLQGKPLVRIEAPLRPHVVNDQAIWARRVHLEGRDIGNGATGVHWCVELAEGLTITGVLSYGEDDQAFLHR